MKKNTIARFAATLVLSLMLCLSASAAKYNGIIAYVEGSQTVYLLTETPEVSYKGNKAILSINGDEVAKVDLSGDKVLSIVYTGIDNPTAITQLDGSNVNFQNPDVKKIIKDKKLIIIANDGKQYDVFGREVAP